MLDADHSSMCKIGSNGHMYKLIKGNIKNLVEQAVVSSQGFLPPPEMGPNAPPLPPRFPATPSSFRSDSQPQTTTLKITGLLYPPVGNDPRSRKLSDLKNAGLWEQAKDLEYQIFLEQQRTHGGESLTTLTTGYNLAEACLEGGHPRDAARWTSWVINTSKQSLGPGHDLTMKTESLEGQTLLDIGRYEEAETKCASVLARQQELLGENALDTVYTQRRLAMAAYTRRRQGDALSRLQKIKEKLAALCGPSDIRVFTLVLDLAQAMLPGFWVSPLELYNFTHDVQQALTIIEPAYEAVRESLGTYHVVTIRALRIYGVAKGFLGDHEGFDLIHRALSNAEQKLGRDHPETLECVYAIGALHHIKGSNAFMGQVSPEAKPWLSRRLEWMEKRKGLDHPEAKAILKLLAMSAMMTQDYIEAEEKFQRLSVAYQGENSKDAMETNEMLQLCRMNAMFLRPNRSILGSNGLGSNGLGSNVLDLLSSFRR